MKVDEQVTSAKGVEFLADVKFAYMEADGRISIITFDSKTNPVPEPKTPLKIELTLIRLLNMTVVFLPNCD